MAIPFATYWLAREVGLDREFSVLASFMVAFSSALNRMIFPWGQYPTVVAIFLLLIGMRALVRFERGANKRMPWIEVYLITAVLILIHHETAYFWILLCTLVAVIGLVRRRSSMGRLNLLVALILGVGTAAFWLADLVKFLQIGISSSLAGGPATAPGTFFLLDKPDDFFSFLIAGIGLAQFYGAISVLGRAVITPRLSKFRVAWIIPAVVLLVYAWLTAPLWGIIASLFVFSTYLLLERIPTTGLTSTEGWLLLLAFVVGMLLMESRGPILNEVVPLGKILALDRFGEYALMIASILFAGLLQEIRHNFPRLRLPTSRFLGSAFLLGMLLSSTVVSISMTTSAVEKVELESPPSQLVSYFADQPPQLKSYRILGLDTPNWLYALPDVVGIPILDGWYPTSRLPRILNVFRVQTINHPFGDEHKDDVWHYYLQQADALGVLWVITTPGNGTRIVSETGGFQLVLNITKFIVWKALFSPTMVFSNQGVQVDFSQPTSNRIELLVRSDRDQTVSVDVKVTYFPYWHAYQDKREVPLSSNDLGFIRIDRVNAKEGTARVELRYEPDNWLGWVISLLSVVGVAGYVVTRGRGFTQFWKQSKAKMGSGSFMLLVNRAKSGLRGMRIGKSN
jgi:hypothetical protein